MASSNGNTKLSVLMNLRNLASRFGRGRTARKTPAGFVKVRSTTIRTAVIAVGICLSFLLARAYEWPLDARGIHEAWELGQKNDHETGDFLAQYLKKISGGESSPYTAEIEILTPYAQIVDQSLRKTTDYRKAEAELDYRHRGNTILVNLVIMLPAAYPTTGKDSRTTNPPKENSRALRSENFWQNVQFNVKQNGKIIPPRSIRKKSINSSATKGAPAALDGAIISLEFDAKDLSSDETIVEVVTPDAKTVRASFDLKTLR